MSKNQYVAYYESIIFDDEDDKTDIISVLNTTAFEAGWYPVPIGEAWLFSTPDRRLYAGELADGTKVLLTDNVICSEQCRLRNVIPQAIAYGLEKSK